MKWCVALTVMLLLLSTGCALNERGYGIRGELPNNSQTMQTAPEANAVNQQLIRTNEMLLVMLQKQNNQPQQTAQPVARKLTLEALGEKKYPVQARVKTVVNNNGYKRLDNRLRRVEVVVDNYYPGKKYQSLKRRSGQINLSPAAMNYLAQKTLQQKMGLIKITGINSYANDRSHNSGLASRDYATAYLEEVRNYLASKGVKIPDERCQVIVNSSEDGACILYDELPGTHETTNNVGKEENKPKK